MALDLLMMAALVLAGLAVAFAGAWIYHVAIALSGFLIGAIISVGIVQPSNLLIGAVVFVIGGALGAELLWTLFVWSIILPGVLVGWIGTGLVFGMGPVESLTMAGMTLVLAPLAFAPYLLVAIFLWALLLQVARVRGDERMLRMLYVPLTLHPAEETTADEMVERTEEPGLLGGWGLLVLLIVFLVLLHVAGVFGVLGEIGRSMAGGAGGTLQGLAALAAGAVGGVAAWKLHKVMVAGITAVLGAVLVAVGLAGGNLAALEQSAGVFLGVAVLGFGVQVLGRRKVPFPDIDEYAEEDADEDGDAEPDKDAADDGGEEAEGGPGANEIRDALQEELERRPMNVPELAEAVDLDPSDTREHLRHLEEIGVAEEAEMDGNWVWRLAD